MITELPVSLHTKLSAADVELIATALATYALRGRRQLGELQLFADRHPEFGLVTNESEPVAEEDR